MQVHGAGPLADLIAAHLAGEGAAVVRTSSNEREPRTRDRAAGTRIGGDVPAGDAAPDDEGLLDFAVVVADHVVDPALRASWTRREVPHLAVVVGDGTVRVGPVVSGDTGPCLQCLEYARSDEDPAWPAIAAQVWGRPAAALGAWRTAAVAVTTVRIVLARLPSATVARGRPDDQADDVQLVFDRSDLAVTRRSVPPHPRCACRALPGTDSAPACPRAPTPAATTSPSPSDALG